MTRRAATRRWLAPDYGLRLQYEDRTRFGSIVSSRLERELQRRFAVLYDFRDKHGMQRLVREADGILERVLPRSLAGILDAADCLHEEWRYPPAALVRPTHLRVENGLDELVEQVALDARLVGELAGWLGEWQQGAGAPRSPQVRGLWDALLACGALTTRQPRLSPSLTRGVTFIGHASLRISDGTRQALVDPLIFPRSARYPRGWQPLTHTQLGVPDAVFITHSHPDHFDLGTLLRFGAEVPIHVPAVARESVLAIDMAARLREVGFRRVEALAPWQSTQVGAIRIDALPFYGEQPTTAEVRHPELRNEGLTYCAQLDAERVLMLADSGADRDGDACALAATLRRRLGPIQTVFGGFRGFALYPVQFVFSSISRHLPLVPRESRSERQQIMCDAQDLLDVAERCGATRVVPYAGGGAPWHWQRGLGPPPGAVTPASLMTDPPARHVRDVARRRSHSRSDGALASPVAVAVMKAGEHLPLP